MAQLAIYPSNIPRKIFDLHNEMAQYLIFIYNKEIQAEQHPDLLKKYPLASNCCRSMNFPLYSMIRESGAKSRTALRIFLFFWIWLWKTERFL